MTFDELLESYDPIDAEYRHRFAEHSEPKQDKSFLPNREELEQIFFIGDFNREIKLTSLTQNNL